MLRLVLLSSVVVLGGCALDASPESSDGLDGSAEALAAYEQCMADAGIDVADLGTRTGPDGVVPADSPWLEPSVYRADMRCIVESGRGEVEGDTPEEVAAKNEQAVGITECMRERGWDMGDPQPHPLAGYLLPGELPVARSSDEVAQMGVDLAECGTPFGIGVFDEDDDPVSP